MSEENLDNEFLEESPNEKEKPDLSLFLLMIGFLSIFSLGSLSPIFYLYSVDIVTYSAVGMTIIFYTIVIVMSILYGLNGLIEIKKIEKETKEKHKIKKTLVAFLIAMPIISSFWFGEAIRNKTLSDLNDYNSTSEILTPPPLDGYKPIVHKVSDYNFTSRSKILTPPKDDILFHKRIEDDILGAPRISKNLNASLFSKSHRIQKSESETQPINININLNINIPGIDVIEQKIPLKIDPNSSEDIDINVTNPAVEKSIRELMNEKVISHDNDRTNEDFHFEAIQNQIKNDLELRKEYILKRELLQHELDEMKHRNESLEDIKKEVMPYLFKAPQDNRFGDR